MCHTCIAEVEELERYWYKPNFTREEAVEVISHAEPGSFIVRDSQSVLRGYALTIKVSEIIIRRKLKVPAGVFSNFICWRLSHLYHLLPDFKVTSDMCVKHFLLQPDHEYPMGIKLQGWNEKPFGKLNLYTHRIQCTWMFIFTSRAPYCFYYRPL